MPSYGQRSDPRAAPECPRHPGVRSVDYCKRCNRPMCVDCAIPTEVRSICVDCSSSKKGWMRSPSRAAAAGAPVVTYAMMAICVLMYALTWVSPALTSSLALVPAQLMAHPWTILTGAFLHGGLLHILFNMLSLYWVGRAIEPVMGWWRFLTVYLVSALGRHVGFGAPGTPALGRHGGRAESPPGARGPRHDRGHGRALRACFPRPVRGLRRVTG